MTIEERDTARAIQTIAKEMRKSKEIDWEQRTWDAAVAIYASNYKSMDATEAVYRAIKLVEEFKR